jgi:hypothetical protein
VQIPAVATAQTKIKPRQAKTCRRCLSSYRRHKTLDQNQSQNSQDKKSVAAGISLPPPPKP